MQTRHGTMTTDRPERYAKQLAGHWARKGSAGEEDGATVIRFDTGQVVELRSEPGLLRVTASVPDGDDVRPVRPGGRRASPALRPSRGARGQLGPDDERVIG